eukprot:COSAG01_NODE_42885_length_435_cov_1.616071_1_plen_73_part_10
MATFRHRCAVVLLLRRRRRRRRPLYTHLLLDPGRELRRLRTKVSRRAYDDRICAQEVTTARFVCALYSHHRVI